MGRFEMKKRLKIIVYLILLLLGLGSAIASMIISVKFLDSKVVWQCLLGAGWTIGSIFIIILGSIGVFNVIHEKEPLQKKKVYLNVYGKQKAFRDKEKFIKREDIRQFLLKTSTPEKIYILSENNIYCTVEVYMESTNPHSRIAKYDLSTRQFFIDETSYKEINDAMEYLSNNRFVLENDNICVIGYEYSSPYYLQKRIEEEIVNSF